MSGGTPVSGNLEYRQDTHMRHDTESEWRSWHIADEARDARASRRAGKMPSYTWSIAETDLDARIFDVLSQAQLAAGEPSPALAAAEEAYRIAPSQDRGVRCATILCRHFPDRQEDAFDLAFGQGRHGGYQEITALPAYAEYLKRRANSKSAPGWRWKAKLPALEGDLRRAESELGIRLPLDYRYFLASRGPTELLIRLPQHSGALRFHQPADLESQRRNLFVFIARTEQDHDKISGYFRKQYGVSVSHLLPIAEPAGESRCLVMHLEKGERFGWCFLWDHDGAWELKRLAPGFDAAMKALTDGIERRDSAILGFLGICLGQRPDE